VKRSPKRTHKVEKLPRIYDAEISRYEGRGSAGCMGLASIAIDAPVVHAIALKLMTTLAL